MNAKPDETAPPQVAVLDSLVKYCRKMSLVPDPLVRIEFSQWEIFFSGKLAEAKGEHGRQPELFNVVQPEAALRVAEGK